MGLMRRDEKKQETEPALGTRSLMLCPWKLYLIFVPSPFLLPVSYPVLPCPSFHDGLKLTLPQITFPLIKMFTPSVLSQQHNISLTHIKYFGKFWAYMNPCHFYILGRYITEQDIWASHVDFIIYSSAIWQRGRRANMKQIDFHFVSWISGDMILVTLMPLTWP